jgi:glycosyltransferase involved in cell wall biosynthesis
VSASRYRVLLVASHPVQYAAPQFRLMAQHPRLDVQVAYCSLHGAKPRMDHGFGMEVAWDIPLLDGYRWTHVPNRSPRAGPARFPGLFNPGLWELIRAGRFDAMAIFTGYMCASFWIAAAAAKTNGTAILFGTDAHDLRSRNGSSWKARLKAWLWPAIFRLADIVIVPSGGGIALMRSLGFAPERVVMTPYVVDNDWWEQQAARVNVKQVRQGWGIPEDSSVALFCAKLQPWKRPQDVLEAFAEATVPGSYLVFAGEGPLREQLEARARVLAVADRVRFLGFVNQAGLPSVYRACDVLVLASEYEPFGVVVNEAMLCGLPAIVSDRVGARYDLVEEGKTGFVFPCGNTKVLSPLLQELLSDRERLGQLGEMARQRMEMWSPRQNLDAFVTAVERAVVLRRETA